MTENDYDEQIAPVLLDLAKKVEALGGSIVARVEWEPGEAGSTIQIGPEAGIGQKLVAVATQCDGNFDKLYMSLARSYDMSASAVARMCGWKPAAPATPAAPFG